jgi:hypothetical protein
MNSYKKHAIYFYSTPRNKEEFSVKLSANADGLLIYHRNKNQGGKYIITDCKMFCGLRV